MQVGCARPYLFWSLHKGPELNLLRLLRKSNKLIALVAFYVPTLTHLINSIIHEHIFILLSIILILYMCTVNVLLLY